MKSVGGSHTMRHTSIRLGLLLLAHLLILFFPEHFHINSKQLLGQALLFNWIFYINKYHVSNVKLTIHTGSTNYLCPSIC